MPRQKEMRLPVGIEIRRCPQNHPRPVINVYPMDTPQQKDHEAPAANEGKCIQCGLCVLRCPMGAVQE